jgi:DNA-directed RNA polymerase specialized sigma24 family protein
MCGGTSWCSGRTCLPSPGADQWLRIHVARSRREAPVADLPDQASAPDERHLEAEQLRRALLSLPKRQRAVVVLRHYEDLGEQQVASILGCTVGTVKSQHARAIKRLRALVPQDIGRVEVRQNNLPSACAAWRRTSRWARHP